MLYTRIDRRTSVERRLDLLKEAAGWNPYMKKWTEVNRGIAINSECGIGSRNPDIKYLVEKGYITIERVNSHLNYHGGNKYIRRTRGFITSKGQRALCLGKMV